MITSGNKPPAQESYEFQGDFIIHKFESEVYPPGEKEDLLAATGKGDKNE